MQRLLLLIGALVVLSASVASPAPQCPIFLASTQAISEALALLPSEDEISRLEDLAEIAGYVHAARRRLSEEPGKNKAIYCCYMPAYFPHKDGTVCGECPLPQLFAEGTDGAEFSRRIRLLVERFMLVGDIPKERAFAELKSYS